MAWIDTEGTFRGERIIEIADRFNLDSEAVLDNIIVARTFTHEMMNNALVALAAKMAEEPFKLLVIDSIMAHFRVDFVVRIRDNARRPRGRGPSTLFQVRTQHHVDADLFYSLLSLSETGRKQASDSQSERSRPLASNILKS